MESIPIQKKLEKRSQGIDPSESENKEKYRSLSKMQRLMCDNVPDMIWAKDLDKRFLFANKKVSLRTDLLSLS